MRKLAEKSRTLCIMAQPMISPLPTPPPVNLLCSKDVNQMNFTIEGEEKRSRRTTTNIHCRLRRHSRNVKLCYISFTSSFLSTSCQRYLNTTTVKWGSRVSIQKCRLGCEHSQTKGPRMSPLMSVNLHEEGVRGFLYRRMNPFVGLHGP